ncbi:MAG: zf-TFIIB domain-containing protein [Nannocystaceae bacterium]
MTPRSPNETEAEYIARQEIDRRRRAAQKRREEMAQADQEAQQKLHWMRCPKCGFELVEVEYRKISVDRCLSCGGTFLDEGELEQVAGGSEWVASLRKFLGQGR